MVDRQSSRPAATPQGACRILVVDDDEETRDLLKAALEGAGYEIATAKDGLEAIVAAKDGHFHLAVLDMTMPRMGGLEAMAALKGLDAGLEFIVVSGDGSQQLAVEAVRRGAYAYLMKPINFLELQALIPGAYEKVGLKTLVGLYESTRHDFADVKLDDLLPDLMKLARKVLGADESTVMLMGETGKLRIAASSGLDTSLWGGIEIDPSRSVAGRVAQWRTGVTIDGPLDADPRFADLSSRPGVRYSLVYPILLKEDLVGILTANRKTDRKPFVPQDLRHAALFCSQIAQAIENAKLYERLEAARREAEAANALKDDLMQIMVHDLKSPLHVIQGYGEIFLDPSTDDDMRKTSMENVVKASHQMLFLVKELLRKGQVESAQFVLERRPTPVAELLENLVRDFTILARKKRLDLRKDDRLPPGYQANLDPLAVHEILANLISNAIKYSDSGGNIEVSARREGNILLLAVTDNGPGIPPEDHERVFQKFQRGREASAEGSGYGLAIVKRLAEVHQGRVELQSSPGQGCRFTVHIPEA